MRWANYTDTADMGDDYLCSLSYAVDTDGVVYIVDAVYSREPMEVTEQRVAEMLVRSQVRSALVESNNGGRGFARTMQRMLPDVDVGWFYQSANKEARILSNASTVLRHIHMPRDWKQRWPDMAAHLISYSRRFRSNRWHDAPDVLTGIVERELAHDRRKRIRALKFN